MRVVGHYDGRVQVDTSAVVVKAVLKDQTSIVGREFNCSKSSERHEYRAIVFLIMG